MVEDASAILRNVKVREAIAVVVTHCNALAVPGACYSGLPGNVSESAVAIIPIERVPQRRTGIIEIALPAVHQVDIHPPVVFVIEEGTAGSGGFR